ncbi:MAG TPA: oxidoreductase, partial [Acidimicrobiales bacterium]|nr:oxidoreductase [Acidimicrobiales bacterium]
ALGNTLRAEIAPTGARVGVAYFAELDTEMTSRGFGTEAAKRFLGGRTITRVTPLSVGLDALERGIARRSRFICAPAWAGAVLPIRMLAQPVMDLAFRGKVAGALEVARAESVELTTPQPVS